MGFSEKPFQGCLDVGQGVLGKKGFESVPSNIGSNINHTRCFSFSDQIDLIYRFKIYSQYKAI